MVFYVNFVSKMQVPGFVLYLQVMPPIKTPISEVQQTKLGSLVADYFIFFQKNHSRMYGSDRNSSLPKNPNSEFGRRMLEKANNPYGIRKPYEKADYEPKPIYRKKGPDSEHSDHKKYDGYKSSHKYPKYDKYDENDRSDNNHLRKRKSSPERKPHSSIEKVTERSQKRTFDNIDDLVISDPFKQLFKEKFCEEAKEAGDKFCELVDLRTREEAVKVFKLYCDLLFDKKTGKRIKKIEETKKIINEKLKERELKERESKIAENANNGEVEASQKSTIDLTDGVFNGEKSSSQKSSSEKPSSDSKNDNWTKNGQKVTDLAIRQLRALCFKARRCFICGEDGFENQSNDVLEYHFNGCVREHKSEIIAETFCGLKFPVTGRSNSVSI